MTNRKDKPNHEIPVDSRQLAKWVTEGISKDGIVPPGTYHQMQIDYLPDGHALIKLWINPEIILASKVYPPRG